MKHDFIEIGVRIRKLRKENKMTQEQLAFKIDEIYPKSHNRQFLGKIERGEADSIELQYLDAISQIFNCDIGYLLGEIDESRYDIHEICNQLHLSEQAVNNIISTHQRKQLRTVSTVSTKDKEITETKTYHDPLTLLNCILENGILYDKLLPHLSSLLVTLITDDIMSIDKDDDYESERDSSIATESYYISNIFSKLYESVFDEIRTNNLDLFKRWVEVNSKR